MQALKAVKCETLFSFCLLRNFNLPVTHAEVQSSEYVYGSINPWLRDSHLFGPLAKLEAAIFFFYTNTTTRPMDYSAGRLDIISWNPL